MRSPSALFISRPVATVLLTFGIVLAGMVAYFRLPVAPLPQVDFPTISVMASMPGASPEIMATSIATPLERHLGQIADVSEMTSSSSLGNTNVSLQFGLDRDINGAARDVQAAITAARADLPTSLRSNPTYRKMNPADAPVFILALTSGVLSPGQIYDAASTILQQKLSQIEGIGQVIIGGSSLPAVRVDINPTALFTYGISLEDVRAALAATNANSPKGVFEENDKRFQIYTNDKALHASEYQNLIIAYRDKAPVRLCDIAEITDGVEDLHNLGLYNGKPSVLVILFRQPGANIIETVDKVRTLMPFLQASVPASINIDVAMDPTRTIRASLNDVQMTLLISIALVVAVVFIFLRNARATFIPIIAVPVSLIGTFAVMYLLDYSLDNLSLMALVVSTGFVVDDAIVVLENTMRHIENGLSKMQAALQGAREVSFTVLSMSLSLIAVFTPILLMGGIIGRLFREFAVTLSVAILVSLAVSLSTTPMLCAHWLKDRTDKDENAAAKRSFFWPFFHFFNRFFNAATQRYVQSLETALKHRRLVMLVLLGTICLNVYLFTIVPKGFFPQQDTGRLSGSMIADQDISFAAMKEKMIAMAKIVKDDPAVDTVTAFTGGGQVNSARMFVALKPLADRSVSSEVLIAHLRHKLESVPGASLFLQSVQDIRMGGRRGNAQYQYTLESDDLLVLRKTALKLVEVLKQEPIFKDLNTDQQDGGLQTDITIDRDTMARLGLSMSGIDSTLYDAFGQRQVSTIYNALNQYHVVMGLAPAYTQGPHDLDRLYASSSGSAIGGSASTAVASSSSFSEAARNARINQIGSTGRNVASTGSAISLASETMIPLSVFSHPTMNTTPLSVNHQGHFAAATISFNLPPGKSLGDAVTILKRAQKTIGMPDNVRGSFQGTAKLFQDSLSSEPLLILAALLAIYIVLGILYESLIHPFTILSTLPSAGVGALLALLACNVDFSIMALIGVILLIGIVKKNAIMMIDFAIDAERRRHLDSQAAIREACRLRFRPIMMTTCAALFGALPLAFGHGEGAEIRQPLGISIVGGLLVSQVLTLYTTPVIYLYLDRFQLWIGRTLRR